MDAIHTFPTLKESEIASVFSTLGIPFDVSDLKNPIKVRTLYMYFIDYLMGVPRDELQQANSNILNEFQFQETLEEAIPEVVFYSTLNRLMQAVGILDFSVQLDVFRPDVKRTKRNLSALINYMRFLHTHLKAYHEASAELEIVQEKHSALHSEHQELQDHLRELKNMLEQEEPILSQLEGERANLEREVAKLNSQQVLLREEAKNLKEANRELSTKLQDTKFLWDSARQDAFRMKGMVVQSPHKVKKALGEMYEVLESERSAAAESEKNVVDLQQRIEAISKLEKDILKCVSTMEECTKEVERTKQFKKDIAEAKQQIAQAEQDSRAHQANHQHILQKFQRTQEKLGKLHQELEGRKTAALHQLEEARSEKLMVEREMKPATKQICDQNNLQAKQIQSRIESATREHEAEMAMLKDRYRQLLVQVSEYHQQLFWGTQQQQHRQLRA